MGSTDLKRSQACFDPDQTGLSRKIDAGDHGSDAQAVYRR